MMAGNGSISRRDFLSRTTQAAAGIVAAGALAGCATDKAMFSAGAPKMKALGANERINIALIGIRSRGNQVAQGFAQEPNVRIKTLVDIDENLFAERAKKFEEIQGYRPGSEYDMRRMFDDPDIDAVIIAVPNHWHALATVWACQAGKHVYVEKPCAHGIWEGRKMVEASRKYNRLVQVGFQNRSISNVRQAMEKLHEGIIGDVYMARGLCYKWRPSIGKVSDGIGPNKKYYIWGQRGPNYDQGYMDKVHYDMWIGPASKRPFNYNRFHYNWHWQWDYGNGDIGNQGPHQFDVARWGLNKDEHPVKVSSTGGFFAYDDSAQETPNTQVASFEYADGKILEFEVRGLPTNDERGAKIGNLYYGSKGWMRVDGSNWETFFGQHNEPGPSSATAEEAADPMNLAGAGGGSHYKNFVDALRAGKRSAQTCDIESGFISTCLPLMANISCRLGRTLKFDGEKERFVGDREANSMLKRDYRKGYVVGKNV